MGGETLVNMFTGGGQFDSSVTALADGSWVVTWVSANSLDGSGGEDGVYGGNIYQRHFANGIIGGALADRLSGTNWSENLFGNGGGDTLDGRGGDDVMVGGGGDDTYIVDSAQDVVDETDGSGTDLVRSSVDWTLGDGVENLTLTGIDFIDAIGNNLDNALTGNSSENTIEGNGGNDTLDGGGGELDACRRLREPDANGHGYQRHRQ